jgi:superfamily II DNA or RNA helicase
MSVNFDWDPEGRGIISGDLVELIRERFSYENKAARFRGPRARYRVNRKYMITPTGRFDVGMYFDIRKYLKEQHPEVRITQTEKFNKMVVPKYVFYADKKLNMNRLMLEGRGYQADIVDSLLSIGRGIAVLGTGGGKTLTMAYLIQTIYDNCEDKANFRCLIVVPDLGLKNQTYSDFNEYGVAFRTQKWDGKSIPQLGITIANMGIIQSKKSDKSWLKNVDLVIVDECHKLRAGNKICNIIDKIPSQHRFGFTGTMAEDDEDRWTCIGKLGPVLYERGTYKLRQDGYLTSAKIQVIKLDHKDKPPPVPPHMRGNPSAKYITEQNFIKNSSFRNNICGKLAKNFNNNALFIVDYIEHGQILHDTIARMCPNKQVFFVRGEVDVDERDKIKRIVEKNSDVVIIAISKIFSTGINIKNLHYIVFAGGGKAKVKIVQTIGRGLRLHESKNVLIIIDLADILQYGYKHMQKRLDLYKKEKIEYGITTITET